MISDLSQIMPAVVHQTRDSTAVASSPATVHVADASLQGVTAGTDATAVVPGVHGGGGDPQLAAAIDHINSKIQNLNRNLEFSLDKDSGELVVKVVDAKTHDVISQIPRKEALQLARNIEQYLQDHHIGLVKTKA